MAACSGVNCATAFVAASTFLSNDATVAEESAARPRPLPANARKLRRVRSRAMEFGIVTRGDSTGSEAGCSAHCLSITPRQVKKLVGSDALFDDCSHDAASPCRNKRLDSPSRHFGEQGWR